MGSGDGGMGLSRVLILSVLLVGSKEGDEGDVAVVVVVVVCLEGGFRRVEGRGEVLGLFLHL